MATFSQRHGFKPIKSIVQSNSIDEDLRNLLWNALMIHYFDNLSAFLFDGNSQNLKNLIDKLWIQLLKKRIDERPTISSQVVSELKKYFLTSKWYDIYDMIEFITDKYLPYQYETTTKEFIEFCNNALETELSAYRFVGKKLTPIVSDTEISSIESALNIDSKFSPVKKHLERSLELLSDKQNPDYRNSIKETISAVESVCAILTNDSKATLGQALKTIENKHALHPALKNSFSSLYRYTSDAKGIRHALLDEDNLKQSDSIYMLVSCSAFINYLIQLSDLDR